MLRKIDPVLSPDLLYVLRAMGHGDQIVIADANFPGSSLGPKALRADGISASHILRAVLSLMPLDTFVSDPAVTMQVVGAPEEIPEAVADFQTIINDVAEEDVVISSLERHAFYARAAEAFAIVQTGETRLYGNIILTKGVIG